MRTFPEISQCRLFNEQAEEEPMEEQIETYGFDFALDEMRSGKKVARLYWDNEKYLSAMFKRESTDIYSLIITEKGYYNNSEKYQWTPFLPDIIAEDWFVVED